MITRHFAFSLLTAALFGTVAACSSGSDDETDTPDVSPEPDEDTADTAQDQMKTPAFMLMQAVFGYDASTSTLVPVGIQGQQQAPLLIFNIGTADWQGSSDDVDNYCTVLFDISGATSADWATDAGVWLGFDATPVATAGDHDCDDFDMSGLGGDPLAALASFTYSIGIGGELSDGLAAAIEAQLGAEYLDLFVGGYLESDFIGGASSDGYAQALEVDESFEVVIDGGMGVQIDRFTMPDPNAGVVSGYYIWNSPTITLSAR